MKTSPTRQQPLASALPPLGIAATQSDSYGLKSISTAAPLRCAPPVPVRSADAAETEAFVWYGSYGSNLCEARFNVYLTGGMLEGQRFACPGARQKKPPQADAVITVPHPLFYAGESKRWGGGVAFLDAARSEPFVQTVVRLYKISLQQFHDVVAQENGLPIPLPDDNRLTARRLETVRERGGISLVNARYGYLKHLGERDGLPILTFTCSLADRDRAAGNRPPWQHNRPAPAYADMIKRGLRECGLAASHADAYVDAAAAQRLSTR